MTAYCECLTHFVLTMFFLEEWGMWTNTGGNSTTSYACTTTSTTLCVGWVGHMVDLLCNLRRRKAGPDKGHPDGSRMWRHSVLRRCHQDTGLQCWHLPIMLARQSERKINLLCFWFLWRAFPNDIPARGLSHFGSHLFNFKQLHTGPGDKVCTLILLSRTLPGLSRPI